MATLPTAPHPRTATPTAAPGRAPGRTHDARTAPVPVPVLR